MNFSNKKSKLLCLSTIPNKGLCLQIEKEINHANESNYLLKLMVKKSFACSGKEENKVVLRFYNNDSIVNNLDQAIDSCGFSQF